MKKLVFFSILIMLSSMSFAQKSSISISTPYKVVDAGYKNYFYSGNKMISVKVGRGNITLQLFDINNMTEIKRSEIQMEKGQVMEYVCYIGKELYMFYSIWDKPNETEQLFFRKIDVENCTLSANATKVLSSKKIRQVVYAIDKDGIGVKYSFSHSFDKSKLLIQYRLKSEIKNDAKSYDIIGLFVFDTEMKQLAGDEFKMPYTEKQMDNLDYSVDSKGNIYLLAAVRQGEKDKTKDIELLKIKLGAKDIEKNRINLSDSKKTKNNGKKKFAIGGNLFETADGSMLCGGLYRVDGSYDIDGMYLFNSKDMSESIGYYEIPVSVMNQYASPRQQKRNEKAEAKDKADVMGLVLRDVVINSDGSTLINAEQFYTVTTTTTNSNGTTTTRTTYYYNFILATKINADGSVAWMKKIPKFQTKTVSSSSGIGIGFTLSFGMVDYKGGMSFKHVKVGKLNYYIFLDNVKNEKLTTNMPPARHVDGAGGFLTAYVIDDTTGEMSRTTILDTRNANGIKLFQFNVNRAFQISDNEVGIEVYKKQKEDVLIKVKLE